MRSTKGWLMNFKHTQVFIIKNNKIEEIWKRDRAGPSLIWKGKRNLYDCNFRERFCFYQKKESCFPLEGRSLDSLLLVLGLSGSLVLSLLLKGWFGKLTGVEGEIAASDISDWLNISGTSEVSEETSSDGTIDLELFHDNGAGKAQNLWHLLADLVKSLLVQENVLVELVLNLSLGPGLLLGLGSFGLVGLSALWGARTFIFGRLLCFSLYPCKKLLERFSKKRSRSQPRQTRRTLSDITLTILVCRSDEVY